MQVGKDGVVLDLDISGHVNSAFRKFNFFFVLQHYCLTSPVAPERAPSSCRCMALSAVVHNLFIYFERPASLISFRTAP